MALLNEGTVHFEGGPEEFVKLADGHVFRTHVLVDEMKMINERFPVVSSVPDDLGYEVELVADKLDGLKGEAIIPNLEHAYVYFMEYLAKNEKVSI
jgi:hypothetical protein